MPPRSKAWFLIATWVLVVLTSCGDDGQSDHPAVSPQEDLRLLLVGDPFAATLQRLEPVLEQEIGRPIDIEVVGYLEVRELVLQNAAFEESAFDLISVDVVWMRELVAAGALTPLDGVELVEPEDFATVPWRGGQVDGRLYGVPIQPHAELLWVRQDLLDAHGLAVPRTTDSLLAVAARLNDPESGRWGIVWNAQRGQPLGQTMAHLYAAHGAPLLDHQGRPRLDGPGALAAARFALALLPYSPPDILQVAWDERVNRFTAGQAAMTYGWGARTGFLPQDLPFPVTYTGAPVAPGVEPITPVGTWSLAVPANIGQRRGLAFEALADLTAPATLRRMAEAGLAATARRSLLADPALQHQHPVFRIMHDLEQGGHLDDAMRPAVPQWARLCDIMGTVFHDMLRGDLSPEAAVAEAQRQAEALWALGGAHP